MWGAQFTSGIGDVLTVFVFLLLTAQAVVGTTRSGADPAFGSGYQGVAFAIATVFGVRLLATVLFGAVLLGPLSALTAPAGALDRRWTMIVADGLRVVAMIIAPLWIDWTPDNAVAALLTTVFLAGVAERFHTVAKDSAAPALLPAPPPEGSAIRPLPDQQDALRRLWARSGFLAVPLAAAGLVGITLLSNVLGGLGLDWFHEHQAALGSYLAAGLFAGALSVLYFLEFPDTETPRPRSPLEGLRRPKTGDLPDKGRTGAIPLLVLAIAATAAAIGASVALAVLQAADLGGGPVGFGLITLTLTGGVVGGIRLAPHTLPTLPRRRLLPLAIALTGVALLVAGLTTDMATVLLLTTVAGLAAGIAAHTGHALLDQETEDSRRVRTTEHLHAVVRLALGLCVLAAPVLAGLIGLQRMESGSFVFEHGGAAFVLMLVGALLLPVAALLLGRVDDRQGVPLRRDLREALSGGSPAQAPADNGFFIAVEGGDGAGKSTQTEALAEWIRNKGHEVVTTREPGATAIGKRLRSILLDVSSAGLSDRAEALLYAADRAEHIDSVVRPALARGAVVISDRYIDSSVAYQGAGRELSPTEVARISRWATDGLVPHLTVLLDVSPETARERFTEAPDRLESESGAFHQRVRAGFLTLAAADPTRYLVVDAGQEAEEVTTLVRHRLDQLLPLSEAEIKAREEARKAAEEEARRKAEEEAARKAEEERVERERQERLERLRVEEEERQRREAELARQREEARRAEEARKRAEEERRRAEEERQRREAEEERRRAEDEQRQRQAEEETRLRAQAEERRREKQRKAEEALLLAERHRTGGGDGTGGDTGSAGRTTTGEDEADTAQLPVVGDVRPGQSLDDSSQTIPIPKVEASGQPAGRTGGTREADTQGASAPSGASDIPDNEETTQLPQFDDSATGAEDETTVMPAVRPESSAEEEVERTRELPQQEPPASGAVDSTSGSSDSGPVQRARPAWAEETPLDDAPTLADELLGTSPEGDETRQGRGGENRRG
ncbi:hypothetical protein AN216_23575 [Streptomyces oceani]|uniref:Thymidylate kinase n=1 Tax=Streptomyces oceani TaxID=1075402 RepID=A0A1E7JW26_9ACTN|nr:hypothetical protein AN216_23575 [Streptomyces oceani]